MTVNELLVGLALCLLECWLYYGLICAISFVVGEMFPLQKLKAEIIKYKQLLIDESLKKKPSFKKMAKYQSKIDELQKKYYLLKK